MDAVTFWLILAIEAYAWMATEALGLIRSAPLINDSDDEED